MQTVSLGDKVIVTNTALYNGRVGILVENSGEYDDPWDYNVELEPAPVPPGTRKTLEALFGPRRIGVFDSQVTLAPVGE